MISKAVQLSLLDNDFVLSDLKKAIQLMHNDQYNQLCLLPMFIKPARNLDIKLVLNTPVGYPYGHHAIEAKLSETVLAIVDGADEIEWVLNMQAVRSGDCLHLANEINHFLPVVSKVGKKASVRMNVDGMTDNEMIAVCDVIGPSGLYAMHISGNEKELALRIAWLRTHIPDAILIRSDIVNNREKISNSQLELVSLSYSTQQLRGIVFEEE